MESKELPQELMSASSGGIDRSKIKQVIQQKKSTKKLINWTPEQWTKWEKMPKYGKVIANTTLLGIKVPVATLYEIHYSEKQAFSPTDCIEGLLNKAKKGEQAVDIGLIIDATGEDTFCHDIREWEDWDAKYVKLPSFLTEKRYDVPNEEAVKMFFREVSKFQQGADNTRNIGVFGQNYNAPGFLIVSFLVEFCNEKLDIALRKFELSCPPGITSPVCLMFLYRKYYKTLSKPDIRLQCPSRPEWDFGLEPAHDSNTIGSECLTQADRDRAQARERITQQKPSASPTQSSTRRLPPPPAFVPSSSAVPEPAMKRRRIRTWVDEVKPLGFGENIDLGSPEHNELKDIVEEMTGIKDQFIGCETVSISATHDLRNYFVSWRARGHRCLLLILKRGVYIINRDLSFIKVPMHFPKKRVPGEVLDRTIIDGVIVDDRDKDRTLKRYLAFDLLFLEGAPVWKSRLEKRLQCLQNDVIGPRRQDKAHDYSGEPFHVRMKDQFKVSKAEYLLKQFITKITHEVQGLVLTPKDAAYGLGGYESDRPLLKYIPSDDGLPSFDGSLSEAKLLEHIRSLGE